MRNAQILMIPFIFRVIPDRMIVPVFLTIAILLVAIEYINNLLSFKCFCYCKFIENQQKRGQHHYIKEHGNKQGGGYKHSKSLRSSET